MPRGDRSAGGRRHVRHACEACKTSKRKCDGQQPCSMCVRYEFECTYRPQPKRRPGNVLEAGGRASVLPERQASSMDPLAEQAAKEATSGVAFLKGFASKNGTNNAGVSQPLAWNLALRDGFLAPLQTVIVAPHQARHLSSIYFEKVHDLYDFLDKATFNKYLESSEGCEDAQLATFYGVLALGSYFEDTVEDQSTLGPIVENTLIERAHVVLQSYNAQGNMTLDSVAAWILQVLYYRLTKHATTAWLTSCTAMHVIQALCLHSEAKWPTHLQSADESTKELYRRQFWTAYLLHSWISFELGKPRIEISHICAMPQRTQSRFQEKLDMYQLSTILDAQGNHSECDTWVAAFEKAYALTPRHDELIFDQTMLCLVFYRHIKLRNPKQAESHSASLISIGNKGLAAATSLIQKREPWWHVASVPFQLLCIFLIMDTHESFAAIPQALNVVSATATAFSSRETIRSEQTAMNLLQMVQKRKESEVQALKSILLPFGSPADEQMFLAAAPEVDQGNLDWIWNELIDLE